MPKALIALIGLLLISVAAILLITAYAPQTAEAPNGSAGTTTQSMIDMETMRVGNRTIQAEVVRTRAERRQGLSGRSNLKAGHGMLFVFDNEGRHGIWMKQMQFPIDIIWLDSDREIVHVRRNVQPDSYPDTTYRPDKPALYVLEMNAGVIDKYGLTEGDTVDWSANI